MAIVSHIVIQPVKLSAIVMGRPRGPVILMTTIRIPNDLADMLRVIRVKRGLSTITEAFDVCTREAITAQHESLTGSVRTKTKRMA